MIFRVITFITMLAWCVVADATVFDVETALRTTYTNCVGIDGALHDMKVKAGIGTAVSGVGVGLGIGATAVGFAKAKTDAEIEEKFKLTEILSYEASSDVETMDEQEWLESFRESSESETDAGVPETPDKDNNQESEEIRKLTEKSKKLGRWRTGLLVGNTATNIAGAIISGTNKVDLTLSEQIQNCKVAVRDLQKAIAQARLDGIDVGEATKIESACKEFEYIDADNIDKINKRATGGMVSSVVGTGTGVMGVITSALANSDKIRKDDSDDGKTKEKNLNTAANVLAIGSTLASTTATVFNATQIKAIKDVASVAEKCTEVLR